ncbi:hypothetical protein JCM19297_1696 [Nonlabens ulvanivorans]|nr:hypothetical protein [Nonlabens ulvanivorans]GAK91815.1 hypothetical protein JCM19297_1696 [Nonlabens ulvanivorans]
MNLYNYDKKTLEKLQSLVQGFYLSYDSEKKVVLSIKSTAGLITSMIKGCPINLSLNKRESLINLFVIDNKNNPQYYRGNGFSKLNNEFENFESIVIDLIKSINFRLVILNEANYQIINTNIKKKNSINTFKDWVNNLTEEFEINLSNINFINEKKIIYLDSIKSEIWNDNLINNKPYFNFDEYLENGTHGYNQEFSARTILSEFYEPNLELFPSLQKTNGEELTDFLVLYKKAVVIIESKYTLSPKQTKFNDAISKSIKQLNLVENIIIETPNLIDNNFVKKELLDFQVILKICVFYDNGRDLTKAFQNIRKKYNIEVLPIFISINILNQFMSYLKILNNKEYKYNIIKNLLKIRIEFIKKNKMVVIDGFDINTGTVVFAD